MIFLIRHGNREIGYVRSSSRAEAYCNEQNVWLRDDASYSFVEIPEIESPVAPDYQLFYRQTFVFGKK